MKALFLCLFFLSFNTSAFACEQGEISFPINKVCASTTWIVGPTYNQFNSTSIRISETNLKLNVIPWMVMEGGHEHGSRPIVITSISPNDYLIEKLFFMGGMRGDWFLKLQLLDDDQSVVEEIRTKIEL